MRASPPLPPHLPLMENSPMIYGHIVLSAGRMRKVLIGSYFFKQKKKNTLKSQGITLYAYINLYYQQFVINFGNLVKIVSTNS